MQDVLNKKAIGVFVVIILLTSVFVGIVNADEDINIENNVESGENNSYFINKQTSKKPFAVGDIINSIDSPGNFPWGLAWDGTHLWCADEFQDRIYKLDTSGNIL